MSKFCAYYILLSVIFVCWKGHNVRTLHDHIISFCCFYAALINCEKTKQTGTLKKCLYIFSWFLPEYFNVFLMAYWFLNINTRKWARKSFYTFMFSKGLFHWKEFNNNAFQSWYHLLGIGIHLYNASWFYKHVTGAKKF